MSVPITVIVLTKDEEALIERCIASLGWADEVVVVDSESRDQTRELANAAGARVAVQPWLGWSPQRNLGAQLATNDWVMFVEADEIVSQELAASIIKLFCEAPNPRDGYSVDRRGDFLGVLLTNESRASKRRSFVRLFNRKYSHYDENMIVHEEVVCPGQRHPLEGVLLHWRGLTVDEYVTTFNGYATVEAAVLNRNGVQATWLHIIGRPIARFGWHFLFRGGFALGTRGLMHALMKATGEFVRYSKLWELQNQSRHAHPPADLLDATSSGLNASYGSTSKDF